MSAATSRSRRTKPWWKVRTGAFTTRSMVLVFIFAAVALVLAGKCVYVQGFDIKGNAAAAMTHQTQTLPADRGEITDRNGQVLAQSQPAVNITADPTIVSTNGLSTDYMSGREKLKAQAGPGIIAGVLVAYLGGDFSSYYEALTTTKTGDGADIRYTMLHKSVLTYTEQQVTDHLGDLGYVGLYSEQAPIRTYPDGTVGANVLGYMTYSQDLADAQKYPWIGGDGVEYAQNTNLAGVDGEELYEWSPYGKIPSDTTVVEEPKQGISYQLTLDMPLQYMQDQRLAAAVKQSESRSGMAITMSVKTGEVLAMSTYPTYDPNDISGQSTDNLGNRVVRDAYEPGSVEKLLTIAALVDQGLADAGTKVIVPRSVTSGGAPISDAIDHDTIQLTTAGIIGNSSNVGAVLLSRQMTKESLVDYLHRFGLGTPTGVGLPGEASGFIPDASMTDQTRDNMSFGQGMSVTAIQEAAAVNAIANGGMYMQPSIIKAATDAKGQALPIPQPNTRQVVSQDTATQMLGMMEDVVALNPGYFDIEGYNTAAKSGTAEVVDPACACYNGDYVMSYLGVAPAENPELLTYVVLDHPASGSGTTEAAPVVHDVMELALSRYGVPLSTTAPTEYPTNW